MDAFYASVETRDNPSLRGKPLIIGSLPGERGVVATCSYEARKFGVHSAMNIKEAYRLCPQGIYMHPNFEKYKAVSNQLHNIWDDYSTASETIALDEAYLDVTKTARTFDGARKIARTIKKRTRDELGLSCSVGVAYSKTAAKTASEENKPNGYFEIENEEAFVNLMIDRDVRALYTVGAKTAEKLYAAGINTVRDIQQNREKVIGLLGKQGYRLSQLSLGIDNRRVVPYLPQNAKSISRELTFQEDVSDDELIKDVMLLLALCVQRRAERYKLYGKGVTLKITYSDMKNITRSKLVLACENAMDIYREAVKLFDDMMTEFHKMNKKVVMISGNHDSAERLSQYSEIIEADGIYNRTVFDGAPEKIVLADEFGEVNFYALPFFRISDVNRVYDQDFDDYTDAFSYLVDKMNIDTSKRNILLY